MDLRTQHHHLSSTSRILCILQNTTHMPLLPRRPPLPSLLRLSAATTALLTLALTTSRTPALAMSSSAPPPPPLPAPSHPASITPHAYTPPSPPPAPFPHPPSSFTRADPSPDTTFYATPRFVTHIDAAAIASLRAYYAAALPRSGRILDFCSSWISHFPGELEAAVAARTLQVHGFGLSAPELARNPLLSVRVVRDLNVEPSLALPSSSLSSEEQQEEDILYDAATCVVSIDYLTSPLAVLSSLRARTKRGGAVHLVVSNRCFPTKAVAAWLRIDEPARLRMVADYLWWSGWRDVEILDLKEEQGEQEGREDEQGGRAAKAALGLMGWLGVGGASSDPLWVVRGRNLGD